MKLKTQVSNLESKEVTDVFLRVHVLEWFLFFFTCKKEISRLLYLRRLLQLFMTLFTLGIWSFFLFLH